MRPNIFLGVSEGSAQYKKWYYELMVDHTEPFVTAEATHLRVGWASTEGYSPYPGGGEEWGGNGVGDDLFSYGFDGLHLWSGQHHLRLPLCARRRSVALALGFPRAIHAACIQMCFFFRNLPWKR